MAELQVSEHLQQDVAGVLSNWYVYERTTCPRCVLPSMLSKLPLTLDATIRALTQ